jgi:hypothetical protein
MQCIGTIDWTYGAEMPSVGVMLGAMETTGGAVLYGSYESEDSVTMGMLLEQLGVAFEFRAVNRDAGARREWEELDGDCVPLLRMGNNSIVRGLDRIKVQQLAGWVGD